MDIGQAIKRIREAKGLSQKEVALICKIHASNYSKIESGKIDPSFSSVTKIAKALKVQISDLFKGELEDFGSKPQKITDKELLLQFKKVEHLPQEKKKLVKEFLDVFTFKDEVKELLG